MSKLDINISYDTPLGKMRVNKLIGEGGQGEVYEVTINGSKYALKWYKPVMITPEFKKSIRTLIDKKSPSKSFVWPKFLLEINNGFGYVMNLRPAGFRSLNDWVLRKYDMDLSLLIRACMKLTDSMNMLHSKGLCYQDINLGNFFMNPQNGEILILDNDNVVTNGKSLGNIVGTIDFLAPEMFISGHRPNRDTDRYSLAVLLFIMLMIGHPLDGKTESMIKCKDIPAKKLLYGKNPVFVFDPNNDSNRPVRGIHNSVIALWRIYPYYIQELFTRAFTSGIKDVTKRPRESEWRRAFSIFEASIYKCPHCGKSQIIYDIQKIKQYGKLDPCRACKRNPLVPRMKLNEYIILLNDGRKVYKMHVDPLDNRDVETLYAQFSNKNGIVELKNATNSNFSVTRSNGTVYDIRPQSKGTINNGDKISFLGVIGTVKF